MASVGERKATARSSSTRPIPTAKGPNTLGTDLAALLDR